MAIYNPRILTGILEELIALIEKWVRPLSATFEEATYLQKAALEQVERASQRASIAHDQVSVDRENINSCIIAVDELYPKCVEGVEASKQILKEVLNAITIAENALRFWETELLNAKVWLQEARVRLKKAKNNLQWAREALETAGMDPQHTGLVTLSINNIQRNERSLGTEMHIQCAPINVKIPEERVKAAMIEVAKARAEERKARNRVSCCEKARKYAGQAVKQANISEKPAILAQASSEKSVENLISARTRLGTAQDIVNQEGDIAGLMTTEARKARTLKDEAEKYLQEMDDAYSSARQSAVNARIELEYRIDQLSEIDRPSLYYSDIERNKWKI